ncbi:MAG: PDZ domain-containing protein [Polyangiaceae bacterium]|nr:PDZ domain-containing protein [Polyangiaceae bacterium]
MRKTLAALIALAAVVVTGCPAVFPELGTRLRVAPKDAILEPPPPENLVWLRFVSASVPEKTRDGRKWDQVLGSLPDPYARLMVNDAELFRTTVQSDTLSPTWPDAPRGNFEIPPGAKLRVELWDSSPINDAPIGIKELGRPTPDQVIDGLYRMELKGGGEVTMAFQPAHPMWGLGFWFELRNDAAFITRFVAGSPTERAGIQQGDQILVVNGKKVAGMSIDEVRSVLNSVPVGGLDMEVRRSDGTTVTLNIKEGPIYPTFQEFGQIE